MRRGWRCHNPWLHYTTCHTPLFLHPWLWKTNPALLTPTNNHPYLSKPVTITIWVPTHAFVSASLGFILVQDQSEICKSIVFVRLFFYEEVEQYEDSHNVSNV